MTTVADLIARRFLLRIAKRLEFSAWRVGVGENCPLCQRGREEGHTAECEMPLLIAYFEQEERDADSD